MTYKNYDSTFDNLLEDLKKNGVAVLPNVLDEKEIQEMKDGMWEMLEHVTSKFPLPIDKKKIETWSSILELYPRHDMLIQHYVGHSQFMWNLRQNPKIAKIFGKIWNCNETDLLTSFDGLSIHFPPEITGGKFPPKVDKWFHTDQSYCRNNFECIQAYVTGYDVNEGDATLSVFEGSHNFHEECKNKFNITNPSDWYKIKKEHYEFYDMKGCKEYNVLSKAGSLVFWDSRTIHQGKLPMETRKEPNTRLVVYICQTPRNRMSEEDLKKKQQAFYDSRMTSHWPHKVTLFPENPYPYHGKKLLEINKLPQPILTDLGKKLAGF